MISDQCQKMSEAPLELEPFPISEKELCDRYEAVYTAAVNDILTERYGMSNQVLPTRVMPIRDDFKVCGIAFTMKGMPGIQLPEDMEFRAQMLEAIPEDAFIVYDSSEDTTCSQWGGFITRAAMKQGARAAAVDGGVRDLADIQKLNFKLFYRYRTSNSMYGRFVLLGYQVPIKLGQTIVHPGDVLFGDIDGVICIPRHMAYEVLLKIEEYQRMELRTKEMIDSGMSPTEVVAAGGLF